MNRVSLNLEKVGFDFKIEKVEGPITLIIGVSGAGKSWLGKTSEEHSLGTYISSDKYKNSSLAYIAVVQKNILFDPNIQVQKWINTLTEFCPVYLVFVSESMNTIKERRSLRPGHKTFNESKVLKRLKRLQSIFSKFQGKKFKGSSQECLKFLKGEI